MAALIAWRNFVDQSFLYTSSGSIDPAHPLDNLKMRGLAEAVRSVIPSTVVSIVADLSTVPYEYIDDQFRCSASQDVSAIAAQPDGMILIGGLFTTVNGTARNRIARLHPSGAIDTGFNASANGQVMAIAVQPDGKILIGGSFTSVNGTTRNRIARLNSDGTLDTTFSPSANGSVYDIKLQPDGKIIVAGAFTNIALSTRNRAARLNPNGSLDTAFNPNFNNNVNVILVQPDGKIVFGGAFTTAAGAARAYLARFSSAGALETGFNLGLDGYVNAISLHPDNAIAIGGAFTVALGIPARGITVASMDGTDTSIVNSHSSIVNSIVCLSDGDILFSGTPYYPDPGPPFRSYLTRVNPAGQIYDDFIIPISAEALAMLDINGKVIIGGYFNSPAQNIFAINSRNPAEAKLIALLGVDGYSGPVVVSHRESFMTPWEVISEPGSFIREAGHHYIRLATTKPASGEFRFEFPNATITPISIGRIWISDALVLPDGVDAGWSMSFRDSGSLDATDGQQWVESPGVITRVMTVPLEGARKTEMHWGFDDDGDVVTNRMSLNALQLEAGTTGEVIAIARTQSDLWVSRTMVYGHIEQPWAIGHSAGPYWGGSLTVVEER